MATFFLNKLDAKMPLNINTKGPQNTIESFFQDDSFLQMQLNFWHLLANSSY